MESRGGRGVVMEWMKVVGGLTGIWVLEWRLKRSWTGLERGSMGRYVGSLSGN